MQTPRKYNNANDLDGGSLRVLSNLAPNVSDHEKGSAAETSGQGGDGDAWRT